jgi:hypothetical protein
LALTADPAVPLPENPSGQLSRLVDRYRFARFAAHGYRLIPQPSPASYAFFNTKGVPIYLVMNGFPQLGPDCLDATYCTSVLIIGT